MRQSSRNVLTVAIVIVAGLFLYRILFPAPVSDHQQIDGAIQAAALAAQAKDANGVMKVISQHYEDDNGLSNDALKFSLVRGFKSIQNLQVSVASASEITIKGDDAHSVTYVSLAAHASGGDMTTRRTAINLDWKKEPATRFLVIPTQEWRVVHASYGSFGFD